jgi:hypothetical protein
MGEHPLLVIITNLQARIDAAEQRVEELERGVREAVEHAEACEEITSHFTVLLSILRPLLSPAKEPAKPRIAPDEIPIKPEQMMKGCTETECDRFNQCSHAKEHAARPWCQDGTAACPACIPVEGA